MIQFIFLVGLVSSAGGPFILHHAKLHSVTRMRAGKLSLMLLALISYGALCVASCALDACASIELSYTQNLPPCHRHQGNSGKQDSAPCARQSVFEMGPPPASLSLRHNFITPSAGNPILAASSDLFLLTLSGNIPLAINPSPPGPSGLLSPILRI
jgi:hypothetical protein